MLLTNGCSVLWKSERCIHYWLAVSFANAKRTKLAWQYTLKREREKANNWRRCLHTWVGYWSSNLSRTKGANARVCVKEKVVMDTACMHTSVGHLMLDLDEGRVPRYPRVWTRQRHVGKRMHADAVGRGSRVTGGSPAEAEAGGSGRAWTPSSSSRLLCCAWATTPTHHHQLTLLLVVTCLLRLLLLHHPVRARGCSSSSRSAAALLVIIIQPGKDHYYCRLVHLLLLLRQRRRRPQHRHRRRKRERKTSCSWLAPPAELGPGP